MTLDDAVVVDLGAHKRFKHARVYDLKIAELLENNPAVDIVGLLDSVLKLLLKKASVDFETARYSLTLNHPDLNDPIFFPFRTSTQNSARAIVNQLLHVSQSHRTVSLDRKLNIAVTVDTRPPK